MFPFEDFSRFKPYLFPGERILWSGQPKPGIAFSRSDAIAIPFSLMWCGFVILWNISVWDFPKSGTADDWFFELWGVPFIAIGLYILAGRFFYDAWLRKRTFYAVTNERVLILRARPTPTSTSRDIHSLPVVELMESRDGTGTISFDSDDVGYSRLGRRRSFAWTPAASANAQFFRIRDPGKVYKLIRDQAHS